MSKCSVCGNATRKGARERMHVLSSDGEIRRVLACVACFKRSITIVTAANAPTKTATLDADERDVREVLRKLARHLRGLARAQRAACDRPDPNDVHHEEHGPDEGLDQAADIADAWAARPEARR